MTVLGLIHRSDDHSALVTPGAGRLSYADLHATVQRIAGQLVELGLQPGDVVASASDDGAAAILTFLGTVAAGAAAAPLNPAYTTSEFRSYLSDLRPVAMLLPVGSESPARGVCAELGVRIVEVGASGQGALTLETSAAPGPVPPGDADAVALLLHTSGTTSRPKSVPVRQRNLVASASAIVEGYGLAESDVTYCVMPLFHVHGLVASTLATLASGGTVVIPHRFLPARFWKDVVAHGVTWYTAVPTIHQALLTRAGEPPEHGLRFARSCSAALPPSLQAGVEERFGVPLVQAYGMTEAAHQMASNPLPPRERRPGSVGLATGVEVAVLDGAWHPVAPGEVGEVAVRGASVIDGYRDNPEANAASFRHGWFRTGDSGWLSDEGFLTLRGRLKELINRGGEKLSPHEIEDALLAHPAVAEAVAYAVPHDTLGEVPAAAVVLAAPAEPATLRTHCAEHLAAFKVPVTITVVEEIPKGPTSKVQRRLLAELLGG